MNFNDNLILNELNSDHIINKTLISEQINCDDIQSKNFAVVSDERKKNNIKYNNISPDLLDNINQVTFKYNNDNENDKEHIGFIAQEIQKYYPELVNEDEYGYLSVKYIEMIPLLLNYNKDMKKEMKEEIDRIKKMITNK